MLNAIYELQRRTESILDTFSRNEIKKVYPDEDFSDLQALSDKLKRDGFILVVVNRHDINSIEYTLFRNGEEINKILIKQEILIS